MVNLWEKKLEDSVCGEPHVWVRKLSPGVQKNSIQALPSDGPHQPLTDSVVMQDLAFAKFHDHEYILRIRNRAPESITSPKDRVFAEHRRRARLGTARHLSEQKTFSLGAAAVRLGRRSVDGSSLA